jgi:hypothetical protein
MGFMKKIKKKQKSIDYDPSEWDDDNAIEVKPEKLRGGISTSIRLPRDMVAKLKRIAKRKGDIGYQTLLKIWIAERLEEEIGSKTG